MTVQLTHHRIVANGIKQHYVDAGSGPPVILLHGFPETWSEDYRANQEDVAQDQVDANVKLTCPTLALWGEEFDAGGKMWDFPAMWRELADDLSPFLLPSAATYLTRSDPTR